MNNPQIPDLELRIPDEAVPYILFQRTKYLRATRNVFYRSIHKIFPATAYKLLVRLESWLYRTRIMDRYTQSMFNEYMSIRMHLPGSCRAVLDIGCGMAGSDPFLARHYPEPVSFLLLDKTVTDRVIFYEYRPHASFYNSLSVAQKLLVLNGIQEERIKLLEADDHFTICVDQKIDLVISLLAWGYHFPVDTYLDQVYSVMSPTGTLIMDLSQKAEGINCLKKRFASVEVIQEKVGQVRVAAHN